MRWFIIFAPLTIMMIEAETESDAIDAALAKTGFITKPWVANGWRIREATEQDLHQYAAWADGYRGSQPTEKTVKQRTGKRRRRTTQERLFGA